VSVGDLVEIIASQPNVPWALLTGLLIAAAAARPLGRRVPGGWPGGFAAVLAGASTFAVAVILAVTVVPSPYDVTDYGQTWGGEWRSRLNGLQRCMTAWSGALAQVAATADGRANVVLFVPSGLLLATWLGRPVAVLASLSALSAAIEVAQGSALMRSCDAGDWTANTLGAAVGVVAGISTRVVVRAVLERRTTSGTRTGSAAQ